MKNTFIFIALLLASMNIQAMNNFEKYYKPYENSILKKPLYLKPNEQPKLYHTGDPDEFSRELNNLQSKGYTPIGISSFSDYKISEDQALIQAKNLKASNVLMISQITNRELSYRDGDDLNKLNWVYQYAAIYLVKEQTISNLSLGIYMSELDNQQRKTFQRNTGVIVKLVYSGGRAYLANILQDDLITHINQRPVINPEDFQRIRDEELKKSQPLNFSILRLVNGQLKELTILVKFN